MISVALFQGLPLTVIPTNKVAEFILDIIRRLLEFMGISRHTHLDEVIYFAMVCAMAVVLSWILRRIMIWVLKKLIALRDTDLADELIKAKTVSRCTHIIPPLVLMSFLPLAFESNETLHEIVLRGLWIYFTITFAVGLNAVITFAWLRFDKKENSVKHPLKGLVGTAHGIVWIMAAIIAVSIVVNKSPGYLLTGMAALSAAVMLIFKDSILGFVAGIQLSANDMLRVGDWIVVPSVKANGVVEDVSLTVVKVRAWDNTLIMLPPYTLVSTSFQNFRGMYDKGFRRIDQSFLIDMKSVKVPTAELLEAVQTKFPEMKEFIDSSTAAKQKGEPMTFNGGVAPVNGTIETNLGLFRAFLCTYLQNHQCIATDQNILVNLLQPTSNGMPLQIYCFTKGDAVGWLKYEAVQSQIMEYVVTTAPYFGLEIYNALSNNKIEIVNPQATVN